MACACVHRGVHTAAHTGTHACNSYYIYLESKFELVFNLENTYVLTVVVLSLSLGYVLSVFASDFPCSTS